MRDYEITFITKESPDPGVTQTIENLGGTLINYQELGQKKFAYPIAKLTGGYYHIARFRMDNAADELSKILANLNLVRFLVVKLPVAKIDAQLEREQRRAQALKEASEVKEESQKSTADTEGPTSTKSKISSTQVSKLKQKPKADSRQAETTEVDSKIDEQERTKRLDEELNKILGKK